MNFPFATKATTTALAAVLAAASAAAQVTDEAVITPYGPQCGVSLNVTDQILGQDHWLTFDIQGATPNSPVALFFGAQQVNWTLPLTSCEALNNLEFSAQGMAAPDGSAVFQFLADGTTEMTINAQAISLDFGTPTITTSNGVELLFPGQSPTVDPSATTEYPCYYYAYYNWNYPNDGVGTVQGKLFWPSNSCDVNDPPPFGRPLVVFMHGNTMDHEDHDYLCSHLARHGFVVASIANGSHMGGSNEGRARQAISYLNGLHTYWGWANRLSNKVAFAGHSRGGEAAITAARLLYEQPQLAAESFDVKAVVSIAPTDGGGDNSDPKENITGHWMDGFLTIYGSRDQDVIGKRLEDPLLSPENTPFAIYDRAGTESSLEGIIFSPPLDKAMIYVEGADHYRFEDTCSLSSSATISCDEHHLVARGYFTAFLRWQMNNESAYRAYFTGDDVPTAIALEGTNCYPQFSDGARRVVDNFEQGGWTSNTMGGSVTDNSGIVAIGEDELWQMDPSAPNDTRGMRIKWNDNIAPPIVTWNIPNGTVPNVGPTRDVTNFQQLSLRVAQNYNDGFNQPGVDQDFYVRLYTGDGYSSFVKISDHGRIPYPDEFQWFPFPYPQGDYTKTAMNTIRIPLDAFGGADLTDVRRVHFFFTVNGHEQGSVHVDSLEFTN